MQLHKKLILSLAAVICIGVSAQARIKLPPIVGSNMVLQRNTTVNIWGWSSPDETVALECSWISGAIETQADSTGKWKVQVKTTSSKNKQRIKVSDKESVVELENILFGEVWLCSGQSNMQIPLNGYYNQPISGKNEALLHAGNPNLRLFTINNDASDTKLDKLRKYKPWVESNMKSASNFSATAYFFGSQLQRQLGVPVGLIECAWNGSAIEPWISEEALGNRMVNLANYPDKTPTNRKNTLLFNALINPIVNYTIKGVLWYQGESNRSNPLVYGNLFQTLVKDWRDRWQQGNFPFYYVQISPYNYGDLNAFSEYSNTAYLREQQLHSCDSISNSGMVVTMDNGERDCIHPANKKLVGTRLLYLALNKSYGFKSLDCEGPKFTTAETQDSTLIVHFTHIENGMYAPHGLHNFEIAGADKVFYPAEAKFKNGKPYLILRSNKVADPVAVRYCWSNWCVGSLYDTNGNPASSFRSDNWDDAVRGE
ncbi:MAG: sialate O-acetylesterase [Mangrovibacterium sp.]